ncbi:MAG: HlyC/CorC family transporter [Phycisphaerales bacterium]|nr:MAG: HlyC/CorC family transporter [Phycisphaerales bacterium]
MVVDGWVIWCLAALSVVVLVVSGTFNLALRLPSRVRMAETLQKLGRQKELASLLERRVELQLATAILRTTALLAIVMVILRISERSGVVGETGQNALAFVASLVVVLVFGVAIPTAWAKYAGETALCLALPGLHVLRIALFPLIAFLKSFDEIIRRLAGVPQEEARTQADEIEREILEVVSEGEAQGAFDEEEKEMIESIIDLRDAQVAETMTPRTEIEAVSKECTLAEVKKFIIEVGHSRIPVYDETIDRIQGVIYAKDLLSLGESDPFDAAKVMRQALFIPESKLLRDLLHEFQEKKVHIAIVLDEYGGTAGLVTIEDILEELVGEIVDEYEPEEPEALRRIDEHTVDVDARMRVDDLNDELHIDLPEEEDYETIGGFIFSSLGRIPAVGETWEHENVRIQVMAAEPRRISRLRLHIEPVRNGDKEPGSRGDNGAGE